MTLTAARAQAPLVANGWSIYAHPIFLDQLDALIREVEVRKPRDPTTWQKESCTKRLAAIFKLVTETIPTDPGTPQFRQDDTLGNNRRHWFKAKFFRQNRLFFRFNSAAKIIVLVWANDERNLRASSSRTDAYATFRKMLDGGSPPDSLDTQMQEAVAENARFAGSLAKATVRSS